LLVAERTEQLKASNREMEDFVYSVSHDLKAPLRSIVGFSEIISQRYVDELNPEVKKYFDFISEAGQNMAQLIDDLLHYSRIGYREPEIVDLKAVMDEVERNVNQMLRDTGGKILRRGEFPVVKSSRALLYQILLNLVNNGIKYHREGVSPQVTVKCKWKKNTLILTVKDNGIGVEPQYLEKIFRIFQRLHSQEEYRGTGIGLSIVKKAATMLGGTVTAKSKPGKGSTFTVELPATKEVENG